MPVTTLPTLSVSPHFACPVLQPPPCYISSPPRLPISTPTTSLNECFFFNSWLVRLPYASIFCHLGWFFVFKLVVVLLLVVQGGKVYLPTPPSWPEVKNNIVVFLSFQFFFISFILLGSHIVPSLGMPPFHLSS